MAISVQQLSKQYGREKAVDGVSFEVATGDIVGFLGPNGAGKTTTMKMLTCYMPPTSGSASVNGVSILEDPMKVRAGIGYLPENNPLYHDMNVPEYLEFSARLQGMAKENIPGRIRHVTEACGLGPVRHKDIAELSKGFRQRVGLAQALLHDPEVLILDEPTSGLDPNQIIEIRSLIRSLARSKTVILSTHILQEVTALCDRVIIIHRGRIVADGTPEQLQEEFKGAEKIFFEVRADTVEPIRDLSPRLSAVPDVESVEYLPEVSSGGFMFRITPKKDSDIRETLHQLAATERWGLLELKREKTSLEKVFQTLTAEEGS